MIKFIVANKNTNRDDFMSILKAQLSTHELVLFALHALSYLGIQRDEKKYILKYCLIEDIPEDFFDKEKEFDLRDLFSDILDNE